MTKEVIRIEKLEDVFKNFDTALVLFIGAGISRRYLELANWETLLSEMAKLTKDKSKRILVNLVGNKSPTKQLRFLIIY